MLGAIIGLFVSGLIVGGLARFALPGPDPMPIWLTVAIGIAGSVVGGVIVAVLGAEAESGTFLVAAFAGAVLILFLYRRFVQKRPLTGPGAERVPLRARGLRRILTGQPHPYLEETATPTGDPIEGLEKLVALRDARKIDAAEFERRKAAFVEKI